MSHASHEFVLWVAVIAYGIHMMEETIYDWHGWVRRVMKLPAEWSEFYLVNAFVIVLGASCAMIGWRCPAISLSFLGFMLVNAVLLHITPTLATRIFSPGLITAVVLFLPVCAWGYAAASLDGALSLSAVSISLTLGFVMMMVPLVLQKTKRLAFFRQEEEPADRGA